MSWLADASNAEVYKAWVTGDEQSKAMVLHEIRDRLRRTGFKDVTRKEIDAWIKFHEYEASRTTTSYGAKDMFNYQFDHCDLWSPNSDGIPYTYTTTR